MAISVVLQTTIFKVFELRDNDLNYRTFKRARVKKLSIKLSKIISADHFLKEKQRNFCSFDNAVHCFCSTGDVLMKTSGKED